jgi:hypothetical protein
MKCLRFFSALVLSLFAVASFAQNATTSLRGVIKDPSGAVVPGASITLSNGATGQTITTTSKNSGEYQLLQIPPATYTITVAAPGFGSQVKSAELLVNEPATINFALSVKSGNEVVDVTEAAQTLNTTDASLGGTEDNATIQALPSDERNVADLLSLQPGVFYLPVKTQDVTSQDSRSGAVNGGRSDQGNVTVDGVDDNDQVNGYAFFGVLRETQDSTEEFRVTTGDANSDAGRSSGAQISLVTKSGTNKFHGAAYEYFRPTNTVANDFFNKQGQLASGEANRPPKIIRHTFGAALGGPIVKDKLFFFANYEARRQAESQVVVLTTPTADYKNGILDYQNVNGGTSSITPAQLAIMDAANGCGVCNNAPESSLEGNSGYPLSGYVPYAPGPGVNPNATAYFNLLPTANGTNVGDGYATGSYTFASPEPLHLNTSIVRLDYVPSTKHRIFVRGNLQDDTTAGVENLPGQPPSYELVSDNKGLAAGDTWTITSNIINDIRYGFTRQGSANSGIGSGDYVFFRATNAYNMATPTAETRSTILSSPVNNIVDNLNITKGNHSIQIGFNWRLIHQNRISNANSFDGGSSNPSWLTGAPPDPSAPGFGFGLPGVLGGVSGNQSYEYDYANLVGTVPSVTDVYNYELTSETTGVLLSDGATIARHFKANEYEGYIQDAWRAQPNLTVTFGLRYTLLQTPWETHGQEVTPTIDTDKWFKTREVDALQGIIYEPDLTFGAAGPYYHKPGFYPKQKDNIAPRFALAYSPDNKTSIRLGAGIYFDHFGEGLVDTFDQNGEFGLSTSVTNPSDELTDSTSPRFLSQSTLPFNNGGEFAGGAAPTQETFPYTAPEGNFAITWGIDNRLKTPYSEDFDLSVQRQTAAGFTVEAAYVGRLGRHLLQSQDLAEPVDYTDPLGGGDYYSAGTQLSKDVDANGGVYPATVTTIPYFEDVFPYMQNQEYQGESATQAIYDLEWAPYRAQSGATTALADIDFFCADIGYCPAGTPSKFWQDQFSSLYAQNTIGMSYYNAGQLTLRHPMSHGFQADVSYTYSRSIDYGSDAERSTEFSGGGNAYSTSDILNTWKPYLNKGVSDFNTKHLVTVDWVYELPFGRGKAFGSGASPLLNALIGGWQSSGIFRLTSGLPFSFFEPGWTTDWQIESYGVVTDKSQVKPHRNISKVGQVTYFANATEINNNLATGSPVRLPYPGEAGERNNFNGDGYIDLDSNISKIWSLRRYGTIKFAWEVYNVTNTTRFDPLGIGVSLGASNLGTASTELGDQAYRRMQFSLRYDF